MSKNKFLFLGGTFLLVLLVFLFYRVSIIQVSYNNSSFYIEDDMFEIGWIHSVEKEPWYETYENINDQLYLTVTKFKTFGAGTPSDEEVIPSQDGFIHMKVNRPMDAVHLVVSKNVKSTLYTNDKIIPLYELVDDYETITIEVIDIPLWRLLRGA